MVVPVLITSCHVSEKAKRGPVTAHTTMTPRATMKADVPPVHRVTAVENRSSIKRRECDECCRDAAEAFISTFY